MGLCTIARPRRQAGSQAASSLRGRPYRQQPAGQKPRILLAQQAVAEELQRAPLSAVKEKVAALATHQPKIVSGEAFPV